MENTSICYSTENCPAERVQFGKSMTAQSPQVSPPLTRGVNLKGKGTSEEKCSRKIKT